MAATGSGGPVLVGDKERSPAVPSSGTFDPALVHSGLHHLPGGRELQSFLHLLTNTIPAMIAYWDADERCRFANQAYLEWIGKAGGGALGYSMRELHGAARYAQEQRYVTGVLRGAPQSFERDLDDSSGEIATFLIRYVPHIVGGVVVGFASTTTEITPLRSARTRLQAAYTHLLAERDRADAASMLFEQLFDNAPDAILLVEATGAVVRANQATLTTFGLTPEELTTATIDDFVPALLRAEHADHRADYQEHGTRGPMSSAGTVKALRRDGTQLDVHVSLGRLRIDERRLVIVTVRDLSELSQAYSRLAQSNVALEQTTMAQQQFIYIASHDLREPMNTISNFAGLLLTDYADQLDETARRYLGYVHASAERMRTLLDDLLGYIRLERAELRMEPVELTSLVAEIEKDLSAILQRRRARLVVGDLPTIDGQASMIRVLLQNLIDNASKFQPDGNLPVIEVTARDASTASPADLPQDGPAMCEIVVTDNGIGIEESQLQRVFEIFRRAHPYRTYPGTGIGLAMCRRIAQIHGGQIWAEPGVDVGARIHVTLPYASAPGPVGGPDDADSASPGGSAAGRADQYDPESDH